MKTPISGRCVGLAALLLLAVSPARAQTPAPGIQPGDRVLLVVTGEPTLTDTFTVTAGPHLVLPTFGTVSLVGVPRDSIAGHLTHYLASYLTRPTVRAQVLLRLGVIGEVARPGFYALPADAVLQDLIMAAGGLTTSARIERADLVRANEVFAETAPTRSALSQGRTFDALELRSGDALRIPRRPDQESRVRIITGLVTLPLAIYGITRIF